MQYFLPGLYIYIYIYISSYIPVGTYRLTPVFSILNVPDLDEKTDDARFRNPVDRRLSLSLPVELPLSLKCRGN